MKRIVCLFLSVLMIASFVSCQKEEAEPKPEYPTEIHQIVIDYDSMTYMGTSLKNLSALFDEQEDCAELMTSTFKFLTSNVGSFDYNNDGTINDADYQSEFEITVDLQASHFVDTIFFYYEENDVSLTVEYGTPFAYEHQKTVTGSQNQWTTLKLETSARYFNFKFKNGSAPTEIAFFGYQDGPFDAMPETSHVGKTFSYFLGMNGNKTDRNNLKCVNYFRDYYNWYNSYSTNLYGTSVAPISFTGNRSGNDAFYASIRKEGTLTVPCFLYPPGTPQPYLAGSDTLSPSSYVMYGQFLYQMALRYGSNKDEGNLLTTKVLGASKKGLDYIAWIEAGNEPNGEGSDGYTPYELGALQSCVYDGHLGTVTDSDGVVVGAKNADSNIKVAMAGLAGIQTRYIKSMVFWLKNNRSDGSLGLDAFNVHTYCRKTITYNGYSVTVGVCPEIGKITEEVEKLIAFRDRYYPETEVWVTEFGWDTNQSYETEGSAHAYGNYTGRQVQAMWLVRAYFMFLKAGVDRAAMYECHDEGTEATSVGKYGTSGVVTKSGEKKDSYYYLYTVKNTMNDMYFAEEIDSGNENVWIYRFENGQGKSCYAVWCPTMDNIKVDHYVLHVDGENATQVEFANLEESGISSELTVSGGCVTVNVSEKPTLVFVTK